MAAGGFYDVLGVPADADDDAIRKAFRTVARECHPDVAGDDPEKAERFRRARAAADVLLDPARRKEHDAALRPKRRRRSSDAEGAFFRAFYERASRGSAGPPPRAGRAPHAGPRAFHEEDGRGDGFDAQGGSDGLGGFDDLFADFGFGAGGAGAGAQRVRQRPSRGAQGKPGPRRGEDVVLDVAIDADVAASGGEVTVRYARMKRREGYLPSDPDHGLAPFTDVTPVEVAPGTRHASVRRFPGLGHDGAFGGETGDLVVRFRLLDADAAAPAGTVRGEARPRAAATRARGAAPADAPDAPDAHVEISVVEALLGGRVPVETPAGRVQLSIPPCTSSGKRFRLRGRGPEGAEGRRAWVVEARIVTPDRLDEAARRAVEALAEHLV